MNRFEHWFWRFIIAISVFVFALVVYSEVVGKNNTNNRATTTPTIPSNCHAKDNGALPDPKCTPGVLNHAVTQTTIKKTICVTGWTSTIRPSITYTEPLKYKLLKAYGYTDSVRNYELDHVLPLELGGDPTSPKNLFPEPHHVIFNGKEEGSYVKDGWENKLRSEVCNGTIKLRTARRMMLKGTWING